eukprot:sb/3462758/
MDPDLHVADVIPDGQEYSEQDTGIFLFRFWRFGEWVEVVVDDWLPTLDGTLIYMHSKENNEFWSALLEKAYAKLAGSYEALSGGNTGDALIDFTGGISELVNLTEEAIKTDPVKKEKFLNALLKAFKRHAMISASIECEENQEMEAKLESGLIVGHAYGVSRVYEVSWRVDLLWVTLMVSQESMRVYEVSWRVGLLWVTLMVSQGSMSVTRQLLSSIIFKRERYRVAFITSPCSCMLEIGNHGICRLIKLRNPWGQKEWQGAWRDDDPNWQHVTDEQRKELDLTVEDDGEFWMGFDDYLSIFTHTTICRVVNLSSADEQWVLEEKKGRWQKGVSDGGCVNFKDSFLSKNHHYQVSFRDSKGRVETKFLHPPGCLFALQKGIAGLGFENDILGQRYSRAHSDDLLLHQTRQWHVFRKCVTRNVAVHNFLSFRLHRAGKFSIMLEHNAINLEPTDLSKQLIRTRYLVCFLIRSTVGSCKLVMTKYLTPSSPSQVFKRLELEVGTYVVIPTTFKPETEGDFLLRIFSEDKANVKLLEKEPSSNAVGTADVEVVKCDGLALPENASGVYVALVCENRMAKTPVKQGSTPEFNCKASFHIKSPEKATIVAQIYAKFADGTKDALLGRSLNLPLKEGGKMYTSQLGTGDKSKSGTGQQVPGTVKIIIRYRTNK